MKKLTAILIAAMLLLVCFAVSAAAVDDVNPTEPIDEAEPEVPVDPVDPAWDYPVEAPEDPSWEDYPDYDYDYDYGYDYGYDEPVIEDPNYDYDYDYQAPTSGTIDGVSWEIVGTTLTISGSGAIPDYSSENGGLPWDEHIESVEKLIIKSGVTSIGKESFSWYSSLKEVVVESGLEKIDSMAFYLCGSLEKITLPSTVKSIANSAFEDVSPSFKIFAINGSYAQSYSQSHGFDFESPGISTADFTPPARVSYKVGDKLELDGVMLEHVYSNGESVVISDPDDFTADITEFSEAGEIEVTVSADNEEYSFTVEVLSPDEDDEKEKKKNDEDEEDEEEESTGDNSTLIIIAIITGAVMLLVIAGVVVFVILRRKRNKNQ